MSFKMTSEAYGEIRVIRESDDSLVLLFGERFADRRGIWSFALAEHDGYTEVPVDYIKANSSRSVDEEHVDRASRLRDRLDNDTMYFAKLDALGKRQ